MRRISSSPAPRAADRVPDRVVIVEDDEPLAGAMKFSLETEGYEARIYMSQAALFSGELDLPGVACFVIDYRLDPLDGLDVLAELRRRGATAPAVLVTTAPDRRCRRGAAEAGAVIVEKPLITDALSREIRGLVRVRARP